ncbi:MAG: GNAT family N-acetyltransferase [Chloroflexi bacterium]|nr:GNAT family N-acetyltransferase [Chloroflexota bacterium]
MTTLYGLLVDLVPTRPEYVDKMVEFWNNDSRRWATMGDYGPISRAQIKRMVEERSGARERGYTGVHFMMQDKNGQIIGNIGLNWVDQWNRYANLGAWIGDEAYWGGGFGADGLLLLTDYAFDWLDLRRLFLGTMGLNERAQRSVEKCGFLLEARRRSATFVDGKPVDELEYGMMREEWLGREVMIEQLGLREKAAQRYGKAE